MDDFVEVPLGFVTNGAPGIPCDGLTIVLATNKNGEPALLFIFERDGEPLLPGFMLMGNTEGIVNMMMAQVDRMKTMQGRTWHTDAEGKPHFDDEEPEKQVVCPGCGRRLFGDIATRGGCESCYPTLPEGEVAL